MKFLCLAYGDEAGWNSLNSDQKRDALDHDARIRDRGSLMSAVQTKVTTVRNSNGLEVHDGASTNHHLPLAGFSVIEAANILEVVEMVSKTPCARARGFIEIRAFLD